MPPLLLANWRVINRAFCALCWVAAVVLAMVIIGHLMAASTACASKQLPAAGTSCGQGVRQPQLKR